ncbi:hypothetical protein JCM11251_006054 [Rhodosporidiobolus azoricus]
MVSVAELRKKAEEKVRYTSLPSKPTKYDPVRPDYGSTPSFLSAEERRKQSTVLQYEASKHHPPPPPRRLGSAASSDAGSVVGTSAGVAPRVPKGPPPTPARKPAGLGAGGAAPAPPLPTRRDSTPAPPYTPALPSRSAASTSPAPPTRGILAAPARASSSPTRAYALSPGVSAAAGLTEHGQSGLRVQDDVSEKTRPKRFSEYDQQDKEEFFAALDLFFHSEASSTPAAPGPATKVVSPAPYLPPSPSAAPPPVALSTRPRPPSSFSSSPHPFAPTPKPPELHAPSYPPRESHSSLSLSLLHYILHSPFSSAWFVHSTSPSFTPLPPPLIGKGNTRFTCSWQQSGPNKVALGAVVFADTSVAWYRLSWTTASEAAGRAHLEVRREGRYRPQCEPMEADELYAASEMYGPLICAWAEDAERAGVPVARGECWDLANEALLHIQNDHAHLPPPFPSISRTHGSLLYYASADPGGERGVGGEVVGTWTGGDVYVRPGDVVEWRKVKIREVGALPGSYSKLGDPDHTALILSASPPSSLPSPSPQNPLTDPSYPLSALVSLTVLEQSLGRAPRVASYDLAAMSEGEVWIYRPVPARKVFGGVDEVTAEWPVGKVECWEVGELE